jgi:outer membrane protein assembly factor BamB
MRVRERYLLRPALLAFLFGTAAVMCASETVRPSPIQATPRTSTGSPNEQHRPPFRKLWEVGMEAELDSAVLIDQRIFFGAAGGFSGASGSFGAIDLASGHKLWTRSLAPEEYGAQVAYADGTFYVAIGKGRLCACDPTSGDMRWSVPMTAYAGSLTVQSDTAYVVLNEGKMTALSLATHRAKWTASLPPRADGWQIVPIPPLIVDNKVFVPSVPALCLDAATGREIWRDTKTSNPKSRVTGMTVANGRLYVTDTHGLIRCMDIANGRLIWKKEMPGDISGPATVMDGEVLFGSGDGTFHALDATDGSIKWERVLSRAGDPYLSAPCMNAGQTLISADNVIYSFDIKGKELWRWESDVPLSGHAIRFMPDGLLLEASRRFYRFVHDETYHLPVTHEDRLSLARQMVSHFDTLGAHERLQLARLGDEAVETLIAFLEAQLKSYPPAQPYSVAYAADKRLDDTKWLLKRLLNPAHTPRLLQLLPPPEAVDDKATRSRSMVVELLREHADESLSIPFFLDILNGNRKLEPRAASVALGVLAHSAEPRAVRFMLKNLRDPTAGSDIRHQAYVNLAGTGGEEGVTAVLKARRPRETLPSFEEMLHKLNLPKTPPKTDTYGHLWTHTDGSGTQWGLFVWDLLGSDGDLWVARYGPKGWTDPVFTGVNISSLSLRRLGTKPFQYHGLALKQLLAGAWFKEFVANGALTRLKKDSDGDGWSDIVEARIGTDPHKADSDGDGVPDSKDANPLAGPHAVTDEEAVLQAAFEAHFRHKEKNKAPCIVAYKNLHRPLEFTGWGWIVLPRRTSTRTMSDLYGSGVCRINFSGPMYDLNDFTSERTMYPPLILWNADHTEAKLGLSVYFGGLAGTMWDIRVRKTGEKWVVIEERMTGES